MINYPAGKAAHIALGCGWILIALGLPLDARAEGRYALGKISVVDGGHGIAENEQRILLDQRVDSDCETSIADEGKAGWVVAGVRGEALTFGVKLLGCRRAEAPSTQCRWTINAKETQDPSCRPTEGQSVGDSSWQGFQGQIQVLLPERTGVYELDLECRLGAAEDADTPFTESLKRDLFVTWAAPPVPFTPTEPEWLARAACWAAGLGAEHGETDVLEAIGQGLYRYGTDHWRYGYAKKVDDKTYRFLLAENDAGKTTVEYQLENDLGDLCGGDADYCKCPWKTLVDSKAQCKFGDCYTFSHVLHSMAGVMGVGGLRPVMIQGQGNRGFLTKPVPSLDPKFAGSVRCEEDESCGFYYFGNHSLRLRDQTYHDATFGKRYADADEPIAWSRTVQASGGDDDALEFADSSRSWTVDGTGYGGWHYLRSGDPEPAPKSEGGVGPPLRFTGNTVIEGSDADKDDLFEVLNATLEVEVLTAGEYLIEAVLRHGEVEVARRSGWDSSRSSGSIVAGGPGKYRVRLSFSGEQIFRSGLPGPYTLEAVAHVNGTSVKFVQETPEFDPKDFGELPGNLLAVKTRPVDSDGDGRVEKYTVEVVVETRESGGIGIEARIAQEGVTLAYGGLKEDLFTGRHTLEVELPVAESQRSGIDTPLQVTVILYDSKLQAVSALTESIDGSGWVPKAGDRE